MRKHLIALTLLVGCSSEAGGLAEGERMFTGRILLEEEGSDATTRRALQVVAMYAAPTCTAGIPVGTAADGVAACGIFGEPFDPGMQGGGVVSEPFRTVVPCDLTVNLVVQTLGSSEGQSLGDLLGVLLFPGGAGGQPTTLLAREPECRDTPRLATNVLDLGTLGVSLRQAEGDELPLLPVGGVAGGQDALAVIDTDQDLTPNAADDDDDDDGLADVSDEDADGDGEADLAQVFAPGWLGR